MSWKNVFLIGYFCNKFLVQEIMNSYELLNTLVDALKSIESTKKGLPIGVVYIQKVFKELSDNLNNSEIYLFHFM